MPDQKPTGFTDTILSFANLVASYTLPGPLAQVVTTVLPAVANMILPREAVEAMVAGGASASQTIITQDGQKFVITISRKETPEMFAAIAMAHAAHLARDNSSEYAKTEQFFPISQVAGQAGNNPTATGSFSLLNGILGVTW